MPVQPLIAALVEVVVPKFEYRGLSFFVARQDGSDSNSYQTVSKPLRRSRAEVLERGLGLFQCVLCVDGEAYISGKASKARYVWHLG